VVHVGAKIKNTHFKQLGVKFPFRDINSMTSGYQKWDGKSTLCRPTFKSGTVFTVTAVCSAAPDDSYTLGASALEKMAE